MGEPSIKIGRDQYITKGYIRKRMATLIAHAPGERERRWLAAQEEKILGATTLAYRKAEFWRTLDIVTDREIWGGPDSK